MKSALAFRWDGESLAPRHPRLCDRELVVGEDYLINLEHERSAASHRHYFACIREAWINMPGELADRYPSPEALRKAALIRAGHHDERSIVCASRAEALRVAAFIKPMDDYALVATSEAVVRVFTAKSQSVRAMGKAAFEKSKADVLQTLADMIGVTTQALHEHARAA